MKYRGVGGLVIHPFVPPQKQPTYEDTDLRQVFDRERFYHYTSLQNGLTVGLICVIYPVINTCDTVQRPNMIVAFCHYSGKFLCMEFYDTTNQDERVGVGTFEEHCTP